MLKYLTNHWRYRFIIVCLAGAQDLIPQLTFEATFLSGYFSPPFDLINIVRWTTSVEEATVPLHPAIWVLLLYPATSFPLKEPRTTFYFVAIVKNTTGSNKLSFFKSFPPFIRKFLMLISEVLAKNQGLNWPKVAPLVHKWTQAENLRWCKVRFERRKLFLIWKHDSFWL